MTDLLINIDHVATLRNARRERFPDPVAAARECLEGGAKGIVFHLRADRRHIVDADVYRLKSELDTQKVDAPNGFDSKYFFKNQSTGIYCNSNFCKYITNQ